MCVPISFRIHNSLFVSCLSTRDHKPHRLSAVHLVGAEVHSDPVFTAFIDLDASTLSLNATLSSLASNTVFSDWPFLTRCSPLILDTINSKLGLPQPSLPRPPKQPSLIPSDLVGPTHEWTSVTTWICVPFWMNSWIWICTFDLLECGISTHWWN